MAITKKTPPTRKYKAPISRGGRGPQCDRNIVDQDFVAIYTKVPVSIYQAVIKDAKLYGLPKSHWWRKWAIEGHARDFIKKEGTGGVSRMEKSHPCDLHTWLDEPI